MGGPVRLMVGFAAAVIGCNMITGVDQLERVDSLGDNPTPNPDAETSSDAAEDDGGHFSDAHVHGLDDASANFDATPTPFDAGGIDAGASVCQGLTTLWRFDGKPTSSQNDAPKNSPNFSYGQGKFGQAMTVPNNQHVEYNAQRGATPIVLPTQGTVSLWVKTSTWNYPCQTMEHTFFSLDSDGVFSDCYPTGELGVWIQTGPNSGVGASIVAQNGQWTNGYNHIVATWSQSPPSMSYVFNATITNTTTDAWTSPHPAVTTFYLSYPDEPIGSYLDDVAIWNRPITNAEIAAIYGAGKSIGDLCGLP
jgi:hypothetical protein